MASFPMTLNVPNPSVKGTVLFKDECLKSAFYTVQLKTAHLLNLKCNVPLRAAPLQ